MNYLLLASSVALLAVPSIAQAQAKVYMGVNTGTLSPTENNALTDAGLAFGASVTVGPHQWFGLGFSYLGAINGQTALGEDTSFQSGLLDAKLMSPMVDGLGRGVTPYLRAGLGVYEFKANILGFPASTGINAQIPLGGGLLLDLNDNLAVGGDFAYHILFDGNFDENPQRENIDAWDASVNLVFKM